MKSACRRLPPYVPQSVGCVNPLYNLCYQRLGLTGRCNVPYHEGLAMTRKLVSKKDLKSIYGIPYCFAHIARLEVAGKFPQRVALGACRVAWVAEEVEAWIEERIANRPLTSPS